MGGREREEGVRGEGERRGGERGGGVREERGGGGRRCVFEVYSRCDVM